jgi:hypothetical protein
MEGPVSHHEKSGAKKPAATKKAAATKKTPKK